MEVLLEVVRMTPEERIALVRELAATTPFRMAERR